MGGSLGLGNPENKNGALLSRWWWGFGVEREAVWRRVIVAKDGVNKLGWWPSLGPSYRRSSH